MAKLIINRDLFVRDPELFEKQVERIFCEISGLSAFYPDFDSWFRGKVLPGLHSGERSLILRVHGQENAGIAVVKNGGGEKKLCCLRVMPSHTGSGVGLHLFEDSFELLGTDKPLLSVAEEQLPKFDRTFSHFGFDLSAQYVGMYRSRKIELAFNGLLDQKAANNE